MYAKCFDKDHGELAFFAKGENRKKDHPTGLTDPVDVLVLRVQKEGFGYPDVRKFLFQFA